MATCEDEEDVAVMGCESAAEVLAETPLSRVVAGEGDFEGLAVEGLACGEGLFTAAKLDR